ncbi:cytochrome o ubiquinol oxidase subunit IV [Allopusillimonas soli]|uniref:Cytochrome bo(3) ubiquinol oxidase subunit 4 n=1 Tax=Allopusillimonas soli TaxID=659016 RepID=A0A853F810_9BURK|nr:cytochrome o ubiquinol oxidase subunit IV [Allopusillimonas soli]NYT35958.1 cytochrome o ubiquinol oxidase subunit IV [Allopusillimonas soli]TEA76305.1 cytochrome o ubiquinol oxidase subunit IV [Allopusillimonas soli]
MSVNQHDEHAHDAHGPEGGHAPSTFKGYMTGFILSVILTVIPFWLVMNDVLSTSSATALTILGIGAVQMVVHMIYFLHMSPRSEGGWTLLALIFTVIIVVIAMAGSLWVMYHLNTNMMPGHLHEMPSM